MTAYVLYYIDFAPTSKEVEAKVPLLATKSSASPSRKKQRLTDWQKQLVLVSPETCVVVECIMTFVSPFECDSSDQVVDMWRMLFCMMVL